MTRHALVVGINQYPFLQDTPTSKQKNLKTPARDAEAIAQLLEADDNFRVQRLPNSNIDGKLQVDPNKSVTVDDLLDEITKLFIPEDGRDTALLFFAGHGLPKPLGSLKQIMLATSDANPRSKKWNGVLLRDLWEIVEQSPVKEQIIWLDCCYSGELLEFKDKDLLERISGRKRFLIAASHSSEVAYERLDGKHGVLSGTLIEGLNSSKVLQGDWITDRTLADFVETELKAYYTQTKIPQLPQIRRPDQAIKLVLCQDQSSFQESQDIKQSKTRKIPFVLPQLDVSTFTGRDEELRRLEELLLNRQGTKVCSIAGLAGVGGIGKSALACHFATIHKDDFPDGVIGLRVDGKDIDTIAREFARRCGEEIDSEDERNATTIMQEVFAHRRMLLIFDNAEDSEIRELRPGGERCAVIITTRDRALPISLDIPDQGRINLPTLSDPDSLRLLQNLLGEERVAAEPQGASYLIELSGKLPLALQIIGAALKLHEGRSLADYAASLNEERRLSRLKVRGSQHLDVRSSFSLSLKLLQSEEIDFFSSLSVCAEDGFSLRTAMAVNDCDEYTVLEYLDYLYQLSLLNYSEVEKNRFVFHPLIRLFAQDLAVERNLQDEAQARHAQFFTEFVKSSQVNDPSTASVLAKELKDIVLAGEWLQRQKIADYKFAICLLPFFHKYGYWQQAVNFMSGFQLLAKRKEDWNVVVLLCIQQAKYLSLLGEWSRAEEVLKEIADIPDKIQERDISQRCKVMWLNALGSSLQRQGCLDEAVEVFQQCVLIVEQLNDKRYLTISLNALRIVLQQVGQLHEGVVALQHHIKISQQINSTNSLIISLSVLGELLQEQERLDEAIVIFQRSVEVAEQLDDKPKQLSYLDTLGKLLQQQKKFDEAIVIFQRSVEVAEQLDDKPRQLSYLDTLGKLLQQQKKFDEAIVVFQRSVAVVEQLGNKPKQLSCLSNLRIVLQKQGHLESTVTVLRQSVSIAEQLEDKKTLTRHLSVLGELLQQQGNIDEAVAALQRSVSIAEQLNSKKAFARSLSTLGKVLRYQSRLDELINFLRCRLEAAKQRCDQHSQAIVLNSLGEVIQQQGFWDEAVEVFQQAALLYEVIDDKPNQVIVLNNLERLLRQQSRLDELINFLRCRLEAAKQRCDQHSQAIVLNSLGGVLEQQQFWDEAVEVFQQAALLYELLNDKQSQVKVLNNLGRLLKQKGKLDNAEKVLQHSKDICEDLDEPHSLAITLHSLGGVLGQQQKWQEAEKILRRSYDLCERLGDLRGRLMVLNSLGQVLSKQEEAEKYDLALMYFRASIKLGEELNDQPHLAQVYTAMGQALLRHGKTEEAVIQLTQGFEIDENSRNSSGLGKVTGYLTDALVKLGRREEAVAYCQRALAVAPDSKKLQQLQSKLSSYSKPIRKSSKKG